MGVKVLREKLISFEETVIECDNETEYAESLNEMRKAGFTRVKKFDKESNAMIPVKKVLKNGHIIQRYKRFGGYSIKECVLREKMPYK